MKGETEAQGLLDFVFFPLYNLHVSLLGSLLCIKFMFLGVFPPSG